MSLKNMANVNQGAGPENKEGWEEEERRVELRTGESCVFGWSGRHCDYQGLPWMSGVASAGLRCELAPRLDRQASSFHP